MKKCIAFGIAVGIGTALLCGGVTMAAQQPAAVRTLLLKDPHVIDHRKRFVYLSRNPDSALVGDPRLDGASLNAVLSPGGTQCFSLPASGWSPIPGGFKYKDLSLANGPVRIALIRASGSGGFVLKVVGKLAGITLVPGNPTNSYGLNFKIDGGGDEYCASTGSAVPAANSDTLFLVRNDTGTACTAPACSSPSAAFLDRPLVY